MNERKVVVYFHVAFETHKFTINREADISHVMSIDSLLFNLDVELLQQIWNKKEKNGQLLYHERKKLNKLLRFDHCTTINRYKYEL